MVRAGFERLFRTLVGPPTLEDDPTYRTLREHIAYAQKRHMPTRAHREALADYLHALLKPRPFA